MGAGDDRPGDEAEASRVALLLPPRLPGREHKETGSSRSPFFIRRLKPSAAAPALLNGAEAGGEALQGDRQVHALALRRGDARLGLAASLEGADRCGVHQDVGEAAVEVGRANV